MNEVLETAKSKLASLEAAIAADPRRKEAEKLRHFIEMFELLSANQGAGQDGASASKRTSPEAASSSGSEEKRRTKKDMVVETATTLLMEKFPQTSAELLDGFERLGRDVGGNDKLTNLSAYMSKSDAFVHRRKDGGWFLAHQVQKENPLPFGAEG